MQRSADDPSVLVATYDGKHNHHCPTQTKILSPDCSSSQGHPETILVVPDPTTMTARSSRPPNPNMALDLVQPPGLTTAAAKQPVQETNSEPSDSNDSFPRLLVQQMASSLTRDPNFTAALAAAISGRILDQELPENW